jgi:hypothetical protein
MAAPYSPASSPHGTPSSPHGAVHLGVVRPPTAIATPTAYPMSSATVYYPTPLSAYPPPRTAALPPGTSTHPIAYATPPSHLPAPTAAAAAAAAAAAPPEALQSPQLTTPMTGASPHGYVTPVAAASARQEGLTASESKGPYPALPAGWQALDDGMGHRYYYHWATGVSQWEFPRT